MRRIRWTADAYAEFESAIQFIQNNNPNAAAKIATAVCDRIEHLISFPALGRTGEVAGTRELVVTPYVVVYRICDQVIEILQFGMAHRTGGDLENKKARGQPRAFSTLNPSTF